MTRRSRRQRDAPRLHRDGPRAPSPRHRALPDAASAEAFALAISHHMPRPKRGLPPDMWALVYPLSLGRRLDPAYMAVDPGGVVRRVK